MPKYQIKKKKLSGLPKGIIPPFELPTGKKYVVVPKHEMLGEYKYFDDEVKARKYAGNTDGTPYTIPYKPKQTKLMEILSAPDNDFNFTTKHGKLYVERHSIKEGLPRYEKRLVAK
jgi:hypothetical protein